jgi:hypothetical protein
MSLSAFPVIGSFQRIDIGVAPDAGELHQGQCQEQEDDEQMSVYYFHAIFLTQTE